ncbi:MAG TPA: cytochrome P460 family protein [Vicinamibacteria bacterium]|nr:cytochrome P460 family protein [Vicinamibacteria bacterium]
MRGWTGRRLVPAALVLLASTSGGGAGAGAGAPGGGAPVYDGSGALLRPAGYREWVFVGASLGLSYAEGVSREGPGAFHHTYLRPESYEEYRRTGHFPDKTVLVLELYEAAQKVAPSRHGLFEGRRLAVEAAVKDTSRFKEGWAYFSFGDGSQPSARPFPRRACFDCHLEHAATDNVFVQFYPVLRDQDH